jgi:translation initiation factor IF-2
MNISTLAKILGVSINDLRDIGQKNQIFGFTGKNTRIPYDSALRITKIIQPEKLKNLKNDDKIYLPQSLTVSELAESIGRPPGTIIKNLMLSGVMATLNEKIDYDTASLIAGEMGVEVFPENGEVFDNTPKDSLNLIKTIEYDTNQAEKKYAPRPPIVTVMGHVDHGKTTLLDTIRKTNVVASEAGAITQHISSYQIEYQNQKITFIDTPGHEAFTAMRARGSQLADFIILMVSTVEGIKPQTIEVIERAKLSKTQVIVALNKIDLPNADIERVKNEVASYGLTPEEWGGETPFIPISAKTGQGVDKILDTILLLSELSELKGEVDCPGQAVIIECHRDKNFGVISTVLVIKDKIKVGDLIRCNQYVGKIRRLEDSEGKKLNEAVVGFPAMLIGLPEVVNIGDPIITYKNLKQAQDDAYQELGKISQKVNTQMAGGVGEDGQINIILKADVSGSLEALKEAIFKIPQDKVKVVIKQESLGQITENDVEFAFTSKATILAFSTSISPKSSNILKRTPVNIIESKIIYELLNWVEEEILRQTKHEIKINVLGKARVLAVFKSPKPSIQIFGGEVIEGKIFDNKSLRLIKNGKESGVLEIQELQKDKAKASEVNINQQFGVSIIGKVKVEVGDIVESIEEVVLK